MRRLSNMPAFPVLLFGLFLGLKLGHIIDWSWWLIFTPLMVAAALAVFAVIAFFGLLEVVTRRL